MNTFKKILNTLWKTYVAMSKEESKSLLLNDPTSIQHLLLIMLFACPSRLPEKKKKDKDSFYLIL